MGRAHGAEGANDLGAGGEFRARRRAGADGSDQDPLPCFDHRNRIVRRNHAAEGLKEDGERGVMLHVVARGVGVRNHDRLEVAHRRVARGAFAAYVGHGADDQRHIDAARAQHRLQLARRIGERRETVLGDDRIVRMAFELAPEPVFGPAFLEGEAEVVRRFAGHDEIEERRPIAFRARAIGRDDPNYRSPRAAEGARQAVDVGNDFARRGNLGDRAGLQKSSLHVDHQERGLAGLDGDEGLHAPAAAHRDIDGLLRDLDLVHQAQTPRSKGVFVARFDRRRPPHCPGPI